MAKPKVVGVVSQKGGVGKSTLCQLIAREAAICGKHAKILDFDVKQMTSTDWVRTRVQHDFEPAIEAEPTNLIILPTGVSRADLIPGLALARRIAEMKLATDGPVFALCRVMTANEVTEARATIGGAGFETLDGELIERPGYRQAQNLGRSPTETAYPSLNDKARRLAHSVLDRLAWNGIALQR